jgi:peptidoglycan hydrolase-like protein with peptidoglycan-binding domain/DNA invertase Pin-like site-specific DNA recombinase
MERKYLKLGTRAGLAALTAVLVLLVGAGSSVAGAAEPRPAAVFEATPLEQGSGYGSSVEARRVKTLQRVLRRLGQRPGGVDGLFGPRTEAAVLRFQAVRGLAVDGVVGAGTWKALKQASRAPLSRGAGYTKPGGSQRVRALQRRLQRRGLNPGPVDGRYGPRTEAAVARLQQAAGLRASGSVDSRTTRVLTRSASRRDGERPVTATQKRIRPRAVRGLFPSPIEGSSDNAEGGVAVVLVIAITAVAILLAALFGAWIAGRRRGKSGSADEPSEQQVQQEQQVLAAGEWPQRVSQEAKVTPAKLDTRVRAVGYVSIPKTSGENGALEEQADAIQRLCDRRGWELLHVVRDVENGHAKGLERPGLLYALERIAEGEASCLVVSELERLSRSAADLGRILEWVDTRDARLVAINLRFDTGSAEGRLAARTLIAVGEWEGRRIAEQTKKGLEAARARRVESGRPAVGDLPALKSRVVAMRNEGMTLQAIADVLNAEGVPTLRGGSEWRPSSVHAAAGYRRPKGRRPKLDKKPKGDEE